MNLGPQRKGRAHRVWALAVAFFKLRIGDDLARLTTYLRGLPRGEGRIARLGLVLTALLVVATPALTALTPHLGAIQFQGEGTPGQAATVSVAALILGLAAFAVAWCYLLTAAAYGPGVLWIGAGLLYVYEVWPIGFSLGRSPLQLIPLSLPVMIGALTPQGSAWGKIVLALLVANLGARGLPHRLGGADVWALWAIVGTAFLGLHAFLSRHSWPPGRRMALGIAALLGYFLLVAMDPGRHGSMASSLSGSLNNTVWFLMILWFLLGAAFVSGAIALARFARDAMEALLPSRSLHYPLAVSWGLLAAWVMRFPSGDVAPLLRPVAVTVVLVWMWVVAVRWVRRTMTRQWLSTAFVAAAAALLILEAISTMGPGEALPQEAGALSLLGFVFALVWEVTVRLPAIPASAAGLPQPGPLLLYMGTVLLVGDAALFGFAASLPFFQRAALLVQFQGATALWVPVLSLTLAHSWPAFSTAAARRAIHAFAIGMVLAVPGLAARLTLPLPLRDSAVAVAVVAAAVVLVVRWADVREPLSAGAVGYAMAYGFAAGLSWAILIPALAGMLNVVGALFFIRPLNALSAALLKMAIAHTWGATETAVFSVTLPFITAAATLAAARFVTRLIPPGPLPGPR